MARSIAVCAEPHYHIRWVASDELDWERHDTRAQAAQSAEQISRTDEQYVIEKFDDACVQCRASSRAVGR